ncbi:MAG TPA: flagellar biosynthesis protein FlhB [Candidatus Baltobacteraceae bacterium]|jgi:flagellar biosynthetic protein FlhB
MPRPEQTERATPKRKEEARKRGQVAKSPDLAGAAIFLAVVFVLHSNMMQALGGIGGTMQSILVGLHQRQEFTIVSVWMLFVQAFGGAAMLLLVLFGTALGIGLLANYLQVGVLFTLKSITPSFSKINPATGLKRMFSKQVLVNLVKQLLKLTAVFIIIYTSIAGNLDMFYRFAGLAPQAMVSYVNDIVFGIGWKFGFLLVAVGLLDFGYEKWNNEQSLKMSKQEVKDEYRQSEGNPEAKGAFKRRQREFARRRMMSAVPTATVVVTNPTHYAVALGWDELKMDAPVVVAKGADLIAKRIREIAEEHGVPIMENPPLARTLYAKVDLDGAIPPNMYAAVAQVIAFVFKLKRKTIA